MPITSSYFLILSILSIGIYYLLKPKARNAYLVVWSCAFIASYSYYLIIHLVFYALINYYLGLKLSTIPKENKTLYKLGIVINILQLIIFRYSAFTIDPLLNVFNSDFQITSLSRIIAPIGVSYFTLQGIGYLINVKMRWEPPEKNFIDFLLYLIFYPKFLSGPIERSNHFLPQVKVGIPFFQGNIVLGFRLVLLGMFKKLLIANNLAPYIINVYSDVGSVDGTSLWILLFLHPLYLYFDFSGYTDIARGLAKGFGIDLLPNFNRPFLAKNMTNFWKRFHMSLSQWFNDYVFKLTMFKHRKMGEFASVYALLLTWLLFGIWHGGGWNFMLLGVLQAVAILFEYFTKRARSKIYSKLPNIVSTVVGRTATYIFYSISLVFFFAPNLSAAVGYFMGLSDIVRLPQLFTPFSMQPYMVIVYLIFIFSYEYFEANFKESKSQNRISWFGNRRRMRYLRWTVYSIMLTLILVGGSEVEQFVYVNF